MQKSMRSVVLCMLAILLSANPPRASQAAEGLSSPFTLNMLKNATYKGFEEPIGPVGLNNGRWEGNPYVEGGASRPTVNLLEDLVLIGDLDSDGSNEAVVMLNVSTGGTGQLLHLAVVARKEGKLDNIATTFVGDRIQIRAAHIQDRRVILDVVRAGPQDAACCPGEVASLGWVLALDGRLRPVSITAKPERLTLETIGGTQWVLHAWQWDEEAPAKPGVTLVYQNGRFSGQSGCNNYFASAKMDDLPGEVFVGPIGSTKMGCAASDMAVETRFLEQLSGVKKFGFMAGRLALTYERDGVWGVMSFNQKKSETKTSLTPESATRLTKRASYRLPATTL